MPTLAAARLLRPLNAARRPAPCAQLGDGGFHVEFWVARRVLAAALTAFLIPRREGAQRVLHPVAQLDQHGVGQIQRVLRLKVHAHALAAHQAHHRLDALYQRGGRVIEQQVRFIQKHRFGLL